MSEEYKDKLKSLHIGTPLKGTDKVTTDDATRRGNDTIEHWDDRQSMHIRPDTIHVQVDREGNVIQ